MCWNFGKHGKLHYCYSTTSFCDSPDGRKLYDGVTQAVEEIDSRDLHDVWRLNPKVIKKK
jgi:hypothetical protein